jgi:hypothetical protein
MARLSRPSAGSMMVLQDELSADIGPAHHIAVLEHCVNVLRRKVREDTSSSWLWKARLKAAIYGLRTLQGRPLSEFTLPDVVLDRDEIHELSLSHPLLQTDRLVSTSLKSREHTEWYRRLQERVKHFAYGDE